MQAPDKPAKLASLPLKLLCSRGREVAQVQGEAKGTLEFGHGAQCDANEPSKLLCPATRGPFRQVQLHSHCRPSGLADQSEAFGGRPQCSLAICEHGQVVSGLPGAEPAVRRSMPFRIHTLTIATEFVRLPIESART